MSDIYFHKYTLQSFTALNKKTNAVERQGCLLRINGGFADLFPWPEFGDETLDQQLAYLSAGKPTLLTQQSLVLAQKDSEYRQHQINPLKKSPPLRNHLLMTSLTADLQIKDFKSVKIKLGRDWSKDIPVLNAWIESNPSILVRLDFNSSLNLTEFGKFVQQCSDLLKQQIEFVEDPMPYIEKDWFRAEELLPLACDFEWDKAFSAAKTSVPFHVLIAKPARRALLEISTRAKDFNLAIVVTSSMDHPVGCLQALTQALELKKDPELRLLDAGCLSWNQYSEKIFSSQIDVSGPYVLGTPGFGVGFEQTLEKLKWMKLQ